MERELEDRLRAQVEANAKLRQENGLLREAVARKDETIEQLVRDVQAKSIVVDRCNKTESTSRESDNHLRDREVAILQRKNGRLREQLRAKQKTVSELLALVGKVTAQQGAESSAVEDVGGEDEDDDDDRAPQRPGPAARPAAAEGRCTDGSSSDPEAAAAQGALRERAPRLAQDASLLMPTPGSAVELSPQHAGAALLAGLRAPAPSPAAPTPSGRQFAGPGLASATLAAAAAALGASGAAAAAVGSGGGPPEEPSPELRGNTLRALEALDRELEALEEKKRVVEQLATASAGALSAQTDNGDDQARVESLERGADGASQRVRALEASLESLERVLGLEPSIGPPEPVAPSPCCASSSVPRTPVCSPVAGLPQSSAPGRAVSLAAAAGLAATAAPRGTPTPTSAAAAAGPSDGTRRALEVLDRELDVLEEKKRTVERLAKALEPHSDDGDGDDSDDGFPLR